MGLLFCLYHGLNRPVIYLSLELDQHRRLFHREKICVLKWIIGKRIVVGELNVADCCGSRDICFDINSVEWKQYFSTILLSVEDVGLQLRLG